MAMSYDQFQQRSHENADARRKARVALRAYLIERAAAEHDYRKALSVAFRNHRIKNESVAEAEIHAKAEAADFALKRDVADAEVKAQTARLAELEGERASLRSLSDWAREEAA